jgi:thioredoxin 1
MVKVKRFTATWCGPCRQLAPLFDQIQTSFPNVEFQTIDVDTSPTEVQENLITSVPTVIIFKDGVAKQRYTGLQAKSMYVDTINSLI